MLADLKFPTFDFEGLLTAQSKNIEAFAAANRLVMEGLQTAARRNMEIVQQNVQEAGTIAKEMMSAGSPQDKVARQAELVKKAFERSSVNTKELIALVTKSQSEAAEVISRRIGASLEELKGATGVKTVSRAK